MIQLEGQRGRLNLRLTAQTLGQDLCVALAGGDRAHIGAVALAQADGTGEVLTVPGHRENDLSRELASLLASRLRTTVCVACGIHLDHIEPHEIQDALALSRELTGELLSLLAPQG